MRLGEKQGSSTVQDKGSYIEVTAHHLAPGRCDARDQVGVSVRTATLEQEGQEMLARLID